MSTSLLVALLGVLSCVWIHPIHVLSTPTFPVAVLCTIPDPQHPTPYDTPCQDRLDAYRAYSQHINQQGGMIVNGVSHTLNITYFDVGYGPSSNDDIARVSGVAKKIIMDDAYGYFPVIIAPYSSLYSLVVANAGEAAKRVVYASAAITDLIFECPSPPNPVLGADCITSGKRPGERRFQYTFATNPTAVSQWNGLIYTVKVAGAQTVAIIDSTDMASQYNGAGASVAALSNNLQIVNHRQLQGNETLADRTLVDTWLSQVRHDWPNLDVLLINHWAEGAVGCGTMLLSLRAMNWLPKMVGCASGPSTTDLITITGGATQQYIASATNADSRLKTTVDPNIYSNDPWTSTIDPLTNNIRQDAAFNAYTFQEAWRAPTPWTVQYGSAMYDTTVLLRALAVTRINYTHVTNTSDPQQMYGAALFTDALRQATQGLFEPTWFGRAQFDQDGRLATDMIVGQAKDTPNAYDIVYPLASQTAPFIYPIPTWDERVYSPGYGKLVSEKLVLGINSVVIAVSLAFAAFVMVFCHTKTVKASSPMFLLCTLLGCILMNSSIYTWTLYETNQSCFAHVWLFSFGYILMFAPLFAKTWRLYRIFSSSNLKVQTIPDSKLFALVCAPLLAFELLYLVIWSGAAPFEARTTVMDPIRPAYNYDSCHYNNVSHGFFFASLAYKIALLVAGCVLIFIARNIPSSFNETPYIAAAIYTVLFSSAILVPIVTTDALGRESRFVVRSFGIMAATLISQLIIVVPKIYHLVAFGDVKLSFHLSSSKPGSKNANTQNVELSRPKDMTKSPTSIGMSGRASTDARALSLTPSSSDVPPSPSQDPSHYLYAHMTVEQVLTLLSETQMKLSLLKSAMQQKLQPDSIISVSQQPLNSTSTSNMPPRHHSSGNATRPLTTGGSVVSPRHFI